jgi:hypothetical protein
MYQDCGTWSIKSTPPRFEWTRKNARLLRGFETKSISPLENAMCRVREKKETRNVCSTKVDDAFSSGLVDQAPHSPASSCDNLSPLESGVSGLNGLFSDEVTR